MAFRSVPRPSSPPGAKASTECPYHAHTPHMHSSHPRKDKRSYPQEKSQKNTIQCPRNPLPYIRKYSASHATFMSPSDRHTPNLLASDRPISQPTRRVRPTRDTAAPRERTNLFTLTKNQLIRRKQPVQPFGTKLSSHFLMMPGGGRRVRTDDPLLAKQVLSQLSYAPTIGQHSPDSHPDQLFRHLTPRKNNPAKRQILLNQRPWWAREDLNLRPHAYQACALTN